MFGDQLSYNLIDKLRTAMAVLSNSRRLFNDVAIFTFYLNFLLTFLDKYTSIRVAISVLVS